MHKAANEVKLQFSQLYNLHVLPIQPNTFSSHSFGQDEPTKKREMNRIGVAKGKKVYVCGWL